MLNKILRIAFAIWIALWLWFICRELFIKGKANDYKALLSRSYEGKHAYVTGDDLYEFINFCKSRLPENTRYDVSGISENCGLLGLNRAIYYLYPRLKGAEAEYILVYRIVGARQSGYNLFAGLDEKRYILKKV